MKDNKGKSTPVDLLPLDSKRFVVKGSRSGFLVVDTTDKRLITENQSYRMACAHCKFLNDKYKK
ncbi:hypothetical protein ACVFVN_03605 [Soonwooa purpurea]